MSDGPFGIDGHARRSSPHCILHSMARECDAQNAECHGLNFTAVGLGVEPKILKLPNGLLVLSTGRLGQFLWAAWQCFIAAFIVLLSSHISSSIALCSVCPLQLCPHPAFLPFAHVWHLTCVLCCWLHLAQLGG